MHGFYDLVRPDKLTRDDLPRVLRPFWAVSQLRELWAEGGRNRLLVSDEHFDGFSCSNYRDDKVLRTLEQALDSGSLVMLASQDVTFAPVVTGRGAQMQLQPDLRRESSALKSELTLALQRRPGGHRGRTPKPQSVDSQPLTFEESVAANKQFFGQPVSASEALPTPPEGASQHNQAQAPSASLSQAQAQQNEAYEEASTSSPEPAFHVVRKPISRTALLAQLYGDISAKPEHFDRLNPGLGSHVLPGEMIVLGDPEGVSCTRLESDLMEMAEQVNAKVRELDEDEAQVATDYYDLLEMMTSNTQIGLGVGAVMIEKQIAGIESTLRNIERLHQDSYSKHGNLNNADFFNKRQALLKQLDFGLGSVARKGMSLNDNPRLKRALGVSTKSLVHSWKQAGVGGLPGYASQYEKLASWTKYARNGAHLAIVLDGAISGVKIKEACTSGDGQSCEVVAYKETGRVLGSAGGGYIGAQAALACGLLGITTGVGGMVCAILVGGTGAAAGGYFGGSKGEEIGDVIRRVVSDG